MKEDSLFLAIFSVLIGLLTISAAVFDWDWFMYSSKARFFVNLFGRAGTRVFYGILGIVIIILGILFFLAA